MITKIETQKDGAGKEIVEQKYNHLAPAEMMKEDNYNKIDGIIDTSSKPTFEERMKDHNRRKIERHKKERNYGTCIVSLTILCSRSSHDKNSRINCSCSIVWVVVFGRKIESAEISRI